MQPHCRQRSGSIAAKDPNGRNAARIRTSGSSNAKDPEDGTAKVVELVRDRIRQRFGLDPIRDIQVLCPMQRGALGARSLNADLQKAPNPTLSTRIEKFGPIFAPGDKIMQTENDYDRDVFNGDFGTALRIDENEGLLVAGFDGCEVENPLSELGCSRFCISIASILPSVIDRSDGRCQFGTLCKQVRVNAIRYPIAGATS